MKQSQQYQEELLSQDDNLTTSGNKQASQKHISEYLKFLGATDKEFLAQTTRRHLSLINQFARHDHNSPFQEKLSVKIIRHTNNFEFIDVQVRIGHYVFPKISIINIDVKSPVHAQSHLAIGSFGTVYQCECQGKKLAVKCFKNPINEFASYKTFKMVLYEYCFLVLASCLKAGPKVDNSLGYQIMVFSTCIEITMQLCKNSKNPNDYSFLQVTKDLKENLLNLHSLNIIHYDIKWENIAFSPCFGRYVFIDFGLSKIVQQNFGQKTLTKFRGTYSTCAPQMKELLKKSSRSFVDVYYNDMYSLRETFGLIKVENEEIVQPYQLISQKKQIVKVDHFHKIYSFKYALFSMNIQQQLSQRILKENDSFIQKIFVFMNNDMAYSLRLQQFAIQLRRRYSSINDSGTSELGLKLNLKENNCSAKKENNNVSNILNQLNLHNQADYYINLLKQSNNDRIKEIAQFLKDQESISQIKINDYLIILSKAIQLHSTKFNIQELTHFCSNAINLLKLDGHYPQQLNPLKELSRVSKFLLQKSLSQQLKDQYFYVFLYSLNNAFILKLFTFKQFFSLYEQITAIPLKFEKKLRLLLNFNSMMKWMEIQWDQQNAIVKFNKKINHKNEQMIKEFIKNNRSQVRLKAIRLVLNCQESTSQNNFLLDHLLPQINHQGELLIDLKIWRLFKQFSRAEYTPNNVLLCILELLAQKNCYQSYNFQYVYFSFIKNYFLCLREQAYNMANILDKYEKTQILRKSKLAKILNALRELIKTNYNQQVMLKFLQSIKKELQSNINKRVCVLLLNSLKVIIQMMKMVGNQQSRRVYYQIVWIIQSLMQRIVQMQKNSDPLFLYSLFLESIATETLLRVKFPTLSKYSNRFKQKTQQYINNYQLSSVLFHNNSNKYSIKQKITIIIHLFLIMMRLNLKKQALSLFHRTYVFLKVVNSSKMTLHFFCNIFYNIPRLSFFRSDIKKQHYLLYMQAIKLQGLENIHTNNPIQTAAILEILLRQDFKKSVLFAKDLTYYFSIHQSSPNMQSFVQLLFALTRHCLKCKILALQYSELCKRLQIRQNSYFILWHYFNIFQLGNHQMRRHKFMIYFCQSIHFLHFKVRQTMFSVVFSRFLEDNLSLFNKRKVIRMIFLLMKSLPIEKNQIKNLCKTIFGLSQKNQFDIQLCRKIEKFENPGTLSKIRQYLQTSSRAIFTKVMNIAKQKINFGRQT